jgi:hypothetical protein
MLTDIPLISSSLSRVAPSRCWSKLAKLVHVEKPALEHLLKDSLFKQCETGASQMVCKNPFKAPSESKQLPSRLTSSKSCMPDIIAPSESRFLSIRVVLFAINLADTPIVNGVEAGITLCVSHDRMYFFVGESLQGTNVRGSMNMSSLSCEKPARAEAGTLSKPQSTREESTPLVERGALLGTEPGILTEKELCLPHVLHKSKSHFLQLNTVLSSTTATMAKQPEHEKLDCVCKG